MAPWQITTLLQCLQEHEAMRYVIAGLTGVCILLLGVIAILGSERWGKKRKPE